MRHPTYLRKLLSGTGISRTTYSATSTLDVTSSPGLKMQKFHKKSHFVKFADIFGE